MTVFIIEITYTVLILLNYLINHLIHIFIMFITIHQHITSHNLVIILVLLINRSLLVLTIFPNNYVTIHVPLTALLLVLLLIYVSVWQLLSLWFLLSDLSVHMLRSLHHLINSTLVITININSSLNLISTIITIM